MPSGPIHQHNRMGLSGDVAADLVEMHLHGLRVRPRQHERRPLAVSRTDGAEQTGVAIALIGRLAGARALSRPQARQAILLAKACFVLEPDLHRRSRRQVSYMHLERVGEVFFKRLDDPLILPGMLRAGADMGKAQFAKQSGYPALGIDDAKARLDHPLQVDPPPADNPVHRRVGAGLDNLAKFFHLDIAQVARPARALAVGEAIRSLFVEPVNPVPQGLAIHPTDPCGLSTAHAIVDRRKRQQTAALPGILATAGEFTKVAGIKVATKRNTGWHGDPPLPTLNQIKTDLGIPTESEIDAVGISR